MGKRKRMNVGQSRPRSPFSYEHALTALLAPARYYIRLTIYRTVHSPSLYRYCSGRYILPCCLSPLYPEPSASLSSVQYCSTVGRSSFRLTKGMVRLAHVAAGSLAQGSRSRVALTRPERTDSGIEKREEAFSFPWVRGAAAPGGKNGDITCSRELSCAPPRRSRPTAAALFSTGIRQRCDPLIEIEVGRTGPREITVDRYTHRGPILCRRP